MFHKCILTKDENSENLESWKKRTFFRNYPKFQKHYLKYFSHEVYTVRDLIYTISLFKNESVLCTQIYVPLGKKKNKNSPYRISIVNLVMLLKS